MDALKGKNKMQAVTELDKTIDAMQGNRFADRARYFYKAAVQALESRSKDPPAAQYAEAEKDVKLAEGVLDRQGARVNKASTQFTSALSELDKNGKSGATSAQSDMNAALNTLRVEPKLVSHPKPEPLPLPFPLQLEVPPSVSLSKPVPMPLPVEVSPNESVLKPLPIPVVVPPNEALPKPARLHAD